MLSWPQDLAKNWSKKSRVSSVTSVTAEFGLSQLVLSSGVTLEKVQPQMSEKNLFSAEVALPATGLAGVFLALSSVTLPFFLPLGICLMFGKRREREECQSAVRRFDSRCFAADGGGSLPQTR